MAGGRVGGVRRRPTRWRPSRPRRPLVDVEAEAAGVVLKTWCRRVARSRWARRSPCSARPGSGSTTSTRCCPSSASPRSPRPSSPSGATCRTSRERPSPTCPGSGAPVVEPAPSRRRRDRRHRLPSPRPPGPADGRVFASPLARKIARDDRARPRGHPRHRPARPDPAPRRRACRSSAAPPAAHRHRRRCAASRPRRASRTSPTPAPPGDRRAAGQSKRERAALLRPRHGAGRAAARPARRAQRGARGDPKVSVNDLVVKAVAAAHERVPEMNVTWTDDAVRRCDTVDIAVAVATDRGLVTPVVRDVASLVGRLGGRAGPRARRARPRGTAPAGGARGRDDHASPTSGCTASRSSPRSSTRRTRRSWRSARCARSPSSRTAPSSPARDEP